MKLRKISLLKKNFRKRIVTCPSCATRVRVPIRSGKILLITCPKCASNFQLKFTNPLKELFSWNPKASVSSNLKTMRSTYSQFPKNQQTSLALFFISLFLFSLFLSMPLCQKLSSPSVQESSPPVKNDLQFSPAKSGLEI